MGNGYWDRCGAGRLSALVSALAVAVCSVREARACGPNAEPLNYFTFGEPVPAPGSEGVPRDTGIVLRGRGYGIGGAPVVPSWFALGDVVLEDAAGAEVPIQLIGDWSGEQPAPVYEALEPLEPATRYRVTAALRPQTVARPAEAQGDEILEFEFTTGPELLEPLALTGSIDIELEVKDAAVVECGPCGANCQQTGTRPALMATVTLPAATGGMVSLPYRGYVYLSDDRPANVTTDGNLSGDGYLVMIAQSFEIAAGEHAEVELELPDEDLAYSPCFIADLRDARGAAIVTDSKCLERVKPSDLYDSAGSGGEGGAPVSTGGVAPATGGSAPVTGGSFSVEAGAGSGSEIEAPPRAMSEGCGCSVPGRAGAEPRAWFAAVLGIGIFAKRRRPMRAATPDVGRRPAQGVTRA